MTRQKVPIVAYHSIADDHPHRLRHLSLPVDSFERQLRYLKRKRFETVTLYDVHEFLKTGKPLPPRTLALTFDDGYLDNWVHAFPLLKKYGVKATIFVVTDFVDPKDGLRPTLEDVWSKKLAREELSFWGHASWSELAAMQASGLVDVQSHTRTHTWIPVSGEIIDFHHPGAPYDWLFWNLHPEQKPEWLTLDVESRVPWGTPVYEHRQNLLSRRFFDDPDLAEALTGHVARHGGRRFFERARWTDELKNLVARYKADRGERGRLETEDEYRKRVRDELEGSRRIISERLSKPVDFVCWPCGDYTPELQELALESGYLATVNVAKTTNRYGDDPTELRRIVFGQDYLGPFREELVHWHFCGNVSYQSGDTSARLMAPIARRLMMAGRLLG